jgi:hypothetical protein
MADSCLNFAKRDTERLNTEIEVLQKEIGRYNETKAAWDTILCNAGSESRAACLDISQSESERLNGKIESVQEKIRLHNETKDAWDTITRNAGSEPHVCQGASYVSGKDGQWHLQRLNSEIELLQGEIRRYDETKAAWERILRNAGNDSGTIYMDIANSEAVQLNAEIDALQGKIGCHIETRNAWETILRNAGSESQIYHGAKYVRGEDRQWHLEQTHAVESNVELDTEEDQMQKSNAVTESNTVWQSLQDACEKTFLEPQKRVKHSGNGKQPFQSLGLI